MTTFKPTVTQLKSEPNEADDELELKEHDDDEELEEEEEEVNE